MTRSTIFSPHCDDELIGCSEILDSVFSIYYFDYNEDRFKESFKLCSDLDIRFQFATIKELINCKDLFNNQVIYAPDPFTEVHPLHKAVGAYAYLLHHTRQCAKVIFYSTNMCQSWIHEVQDPENKKNLLNRYYNSQKSLWEQDYKYFLFEGRMEPL